MTEIHVELSQKREWNQEKMVTKMINQGKNLWWTLYMVKQWKT